MSWLPALDAANLRAKEQKHQAPAARPKQHSRLTAECRGELRAVGNAHRQIADSHAKCFCRDGTKILNVKTQATKDRLQSMYLAEFDRMCDSAFRASLVLFCGLTIGAQAQNTPSGGVIAGSVVDAGSKSPIRRAVITLSTAPWRRSHRMRLPGRTRMDGFLSPIFRPAAISCGQRRKGIKGPHTAQTLFAARRRSSNSQPAKFGTT